MTYRRNRMSQAIWQMPTGTEPPYLPPIKVVRRFWIVVIAAYGAWMFAAGARVSVDSQTYSRWADTLIAMHFNIPAYLREQDVVVPPVLYVLWILVVAVLKLTLGASWTTGIVVLNWLSFASGSRVTLRRIRELTASSAGLLLGVWLFLTAVDLLMFVPFVLSDLMFWALSTAVIGCALQLTTDRELPSPLKTIALGSVLSVIALAFRPVGIPLLAVWMLAVAAIPAPAVLDRFGSFVTALVLAGAVAVMFLHGYLLMHPSAWPFGSTPTFLTVLSDEYRRGVLVYAPQSDLVVPGAITTVAAVRITLQKLLYFLTPWLPHYSVAHTWLNLAFFVPAYGLSAAALANRGRLLPAQRRAASLLIIYMIALCVFHAMMQIEFDHRYRLPMLPALIMLSAIGLEAVRRPQTLASTARMKSRATAAE